MCANVQNLPPCPVDHTGPVPQRTTPSIWHRAILREVPGQGQVLQEVPLVSELCRRLTKPGSFWASFPCQCGCMHVSRRPRSLALCPAPARCPACPASTAMLHPAAPFQALGRDSVSMVLPGNGGEAGRRDRSFPGAAMRASLSLEKAELQGIPSLSSNKGCSEGRDRGPLAGRVARGGNSIRLWPCLGCQPPGRA